MCGIVIAGGNLLSRDVDLFSKLLYADVFRGEHSTGVFSKFKPFGLDPFIKIRKDSVPAPFFLTNERMWDPVSEYTVTKPPVIEGGKPINTVYYPKFMVGHNRYATMGAINARNAHPFHIGSITMVHNGTLSDQSLLPDYKDFEVDSENICHSINKIGASETIQNLDGAFTLVWHDSSDDTLNIIRNSDRPFHLAETTSGDWFGASEEDMLMWILTRKKTGGVTVKRHFECEVGVQYVFDVSNSMKLKEEIKHTLPTFTKSYGSSWIDKYYDDYGVQDYTYQSKKPIDSKPVQINRNDSLNDLLDNHGIKVRIGEKVRFQSYSFEQYPKHLERGKMSGFTGMSEYVEVHNHGFDVRDFTDNTEYSGEIVSCYEQNYILTIIVKDSKKVDYDEINYSQTEYEEENDSIVTKNGVIISKKNWENDGSLNCCANCGSPVPYEDAKVSTVSEGYTFCEDCDYTLDDDYVECNVCKNHYSPNSCSEGTCNVCLNDYINEELINE